MTTRLKCIDSQIGKLLTKKQADDLQTDIERYARVNGVSLIQAAQQRITTNAVYQKARKRQAAFQAIRNRVIIDTIMTPTVMKETGASKLWNALTFGKAELHDEERAALGMLRPDIAERITQYNVEKNAGAILGEVNAIFAENGITGKMFTNFTRNQKMAADMYRELARRSGHQIPATGNAEAVKMAKAIDAANDHLKRKYRQAGGVFMELEDWVLAHSHNRDAMIKAGKDGWITYVSPLLNRKRMVDFDTNDTFDTTGLDPVEAAKVDAKFNKLLEEVYDGIVYGKLSLLDGFQGKSKLANKLDKHRVLHFDPEQWLEYNEKYGDNMMRTVNNSVDRLAGEIALMEQLGPNPDHGIQVMKNAVRNALIMRKVSKAEQERAMKRIDAYYNEVTGLAYIPESEGLASTMQGVRNIMLSTQLGSAMLISVGDFGTAKMAAEWNGIPFSRVMSNYLWFLRNGDNARMEAAKSGAIMELLFGNQHALQRNVGHANDAGGKTAAIADLSLKISGLDPHTQALRLSFPTAMAMDAADIAKLPLAKMPAEWQRFSDVYGLTQAHWDAINKSQRITLNGHTALSRAEIDRIPDPMAREAAQRLYSGIAHETDHAVMTTNANVEKLLRFGTKAGTLTGELVKSAAMYKRFPMMFMMTNLARTLFNPRNTTASTMQRVAGTAIYFTVAGALGMNLRQIASGKDPKDMTKPSSWMEAFVVGGGGGPIFDLLHMAADQDNAQYRFKAFANYLIGPVTSAGVEFANDAAQLIHDLADPKKNSEKVLRKYASNQIDDMRRSFLPGNSLWYTKLAMERGIIDNVQQMVDPDYANRKRRAVRRLKKEEDQEYFAPPLGNARAPDFSVIVGK